MKGFVSLVGAGPGDPELLTLKGQRLLKAADCVLYDSLVNPSLLDWTMGEKIFVGKKGSCPKSQTEITALLIKKAKEGKKIVRLKGGDPFLFGRGGEEALALRAENIPFEIVPGISSALGVPAYAGIPLTHRDMASEVVIITGHGKEASLPHNWSALSQIKTLVVLMGHGNLAEIMGHLMEHGKAALTPAAWIQWGTTPHQRVVVSTVEDLAKDVEKLTLSSPAVVVIGEVVTLHEKLKWIEEKPLFKKRILITRSSHQSGGVKHALTQVGAEVLNFPVFEIHRVHSPELDRAIQEIKNYDWVLFTSHNSLEPFKEAKNFPRVAAIGPMTAESLRACGIHVDLVPRTNTSEGILDAFSALKRGRVLLPQAKDARDILIHGLTEMGFEVNRVTVYEKNLPKYSSQQIQEVEDFQANWILFTSSSTVRNMIQLLGKNFLKGKKVACLGRITQKTVEDLGFGVDLVPDHPTVASLVTAFQEEASHDRP